MPRSMTGFGRGEAAINHRKFRVELKAVNSRHLELSFRIPRFLFQFEDLMRKRIARDVFRGKLEVHVTFESNLPRDYTVSVNEPYADALAAAIAKLGERFNLDDRVSLDAIVKVPDVLVHGKIDGAIDGQDLREEVWELLELGLDAAVTDFNEMRQREGGMLTKELKTYREEAQQILLEVKSRLSSYQEASVERLKNRIAELTDKLGVNLDRERFHAEVAYLAEKSDISEEMARLASHFSQLGGLLREDGVIGRKIDFLAQEMNREVNTIGSKSQSAELTNYVLELKSIIEKIREQAQNIE